LFFLQSPAPPLPLPPFPTRRSSDLVAAPGAVRIHHAPDRLRQPFRLETLDERAEPSFAAFQKLARESEGRRDRQDRRNRTPVTLDRKSTRLNSSHDQISYAVFGLKK